MHNNIMAAGSGDRPPMLATGRYAQWQSRFLRYIDTRPNGDGLRKCILQGPYTPSIVTILAVPAIDDTPTVPERKAVEIILNMSPENKDHYETEKEAIHLLLIGIGDEIYSTVDACKTAHEMFVTIVKQQHDLDKVSYHKLFDVLKQYQKEVNEIRTKRIAKNANPLALVVVAQPSPDPYYQAPKSHKSYVRQQKASPPTRSYATTRHKGKEIAKPITPPSELASKEDSDPEQAQRDKDMQKNLALIAKYFKKIYKPTDNNLKTSSNSRNKNGDTSPRQSRSAVDWDTVFQLQGIWSFCQVMQETKKGKRLLVSKEKMLISKQAEKGVPLQAKQSDWLADTDEEINEQELEAHYSFMAKIQEVPTIGTDTEPLEQVQYDAEYNVFANDRQHSKQPESISNTCVMEQVDSNVIPDSPDMCDNDIQTDQNA
ncbi:hypothetical protein Tco_0357000 [Tanacetum coccineum]